MDMGATVAGRIEIRIARVEDALAIARVQVESWRATYPGIVPQGYMDSLNVEVFAEQWRGRLAAGPESPCHVAEDGGSICGFAFGGPARAEIDGFPGELYAIYLLPQAQSRGLGARLFRATAESMQRAGYSGMYVWVLEQNPSLGFYLRMGGRRLSDAEIEIGGKTLREVSLGWSDLALAVRDPLSTG